MSGEPTLYGLNHGNRKGKEHFTKNRFNSSFPIALLCYMGEKRGLSPHYFHLILSGNSAKHSIGEIPVFGENGVLSKEACADLYFEFEAIFPPFSDFVVGKGGGAQNGLKTRADVVVWEVGEEEKRPLRPFEVKLTVVPDESTASEEQKNWSSEIVVRPVATQYALLSLLHALAKSGKVREAKELIEKEARDEVGETLAQLGKENAGDVNEEKIKKIRQKAIDLACHVLNFLASHRIQTPFVLQPTWWTQGKSPILRDPALDYLVWSDAAVFYVALERVKASKGSVRPYRTILRFLAAFYRALSGGLEEQLNPVSLYDLYHGLLTLGRQTDKDFAVSGRVSRAYLGQAMQNGPRMHKEEVIKEVLIGANLVELLTPERRLDVSLLLESLLRKT